jgi:acrylyl-CoA reductase (NADPH)
MFRALQLSQDAQTFGAAVVQLDEASLPAGDVQARVEYSTLNFKDGLAITHKAPVVRLWPMVAGIDGAGVVLSSTHPDWQAGDRFTTTAGAWARRAGACWPSGRACKASGWSGCLRR